MAAQNFFTKWSLRLLLIASLATSVTVRADSIAVTHVDPQNPGSTVDYFWGATVGFEFTTTVDINVTSLGVWDEGADGLVSSHQVGLFALDGSLLTSTVVDATSGLIGDFRYNAVPSYFLSAGTYVIGAYYKAYKAEDDPDYEGPDDAVLYVTFATFSPEIVYGQDRYLNGEPGLAAPTESFGADYGNFGPNFQYTVAAAPSVPEGSQTAGLLSLGLISLAALKRRRNS